jgi:hypothetical protein
VHAYRVIVDKRDQRAFLPTHVTRTAAPRSVARRGLPIEELTPWEEWRA